MSLTAKGHILVMKTLLRGWTISLALRLYLGVWTKEQKGWLTLRDQGLRAPEAASSCFVQKPASYLMGLETKRFPARPAFQSGVSGRGFRCGEA